MSVYRKHKIAKSCMYSALVLLFLSTSLSMINEILYIIIAGACFLFFLISATITIVVWKCPKCHRHFNSFQNNIVYCPYCSEPLMNQKDTSSSNFDNNIGE